MSETIKRTEFIEAIEPFFDLFGFDILPSDVAELSASPESIRVTVYSRDESGAKTGTVTHIRWFERVEAVTEK